MKRRNKTNKVHESGESTEQSDKHDAAIIRVRLVFGAKQN